MNFQPFIEFFLSNKDSFDTNEEITFEWKTINANDVNLFPFGKVPPIGKKTYKIKEYKIPEVIFKLEAKNTFINEVASKSISLKNKTYENLYNHFKSKIIEEERTAEFIRKQKEHENAKRKAESELSPKPAHIIKDKSQNYSQQESKKPDLFFFNLTIIFIILMLFLVVIISSI